MQYATKERSNKLMNPTEQDETHLKDIMRSLRGVGEPWLYLLIDKMLTEKNLKQVVVMTDSA